MAWEDDDPEEETGPLAVAKALAGSDEGAAPDEMPDVVSRTQSTGDDEAPESDSTQPDDSEQQMVSPQRGQDPLIPAEGDDEQSMIQAQPGAGQNPSGMKAPILPKLPKYEDELAAHQKLEQDMQAVNPKDYKPSGGRRALAGIAAGLAAFGKAPGASEIGESVRTAPLRAAQDAQAPKIAADRQGLEDMAARNQQARQQYGDAGQQFQNEERDMRNQGYAADQNARAANQTAQANARQAAVIPATMAPVDPSNPLGEWQGKNAKGEVVKGLSTPDKYLNTPAGKAAVVEDTIKRAAAAGRPFTPEQESVVRSGGHVTVKNPTNIHVPSADSEKYNDWKTSFQRDNKRAPNAAEIAGYGHQASGAMSKTLADKIETDKNNAITKAKLAYQHNPHMPGAKDDFLNAWQDAQDGYEERLKVETGGDIPHVVVKDNIDPNTMEWHGKASAQPATAPPSPSQRPAVPAQQTPPSGMKVSLAKAMQLPINKGKNADQVKADIQAHGHTAVP